MIQIRITGPELSRSEWTVDGEATIGRSEQNAIVLLFKSVSGQHARLREDQGRIMLADLNSRGGTFVDGTRVAGEVEVKPTSEITIGPYLIHIVVPDSMPGQVADLYNPFRFIRPFLEPVQEYLDDESVSEIMINGPESIFVERAGRLQRTPARFRNNKALIAAAKNIGRAIGREINEQRPILDARLEDGSRVCVVMAPCALDGASIAIRKFFKKKLSMDRLIEFGSISHAAVEMLQTAVLLKKNILVSGGTGSGKTSLLNAVSSMIPDDERIVVIEDSAELQLQKDHLVRLEARQADEKGRYGVAIRDLLRATLRLRPDRIVIGEIRGGEAFDLLQAMNTGHGGSMSTIHANSPLDALLRLENTALQSDIDIPLLAIKQQIASTINIVVHTSRYRDGSRKISHVSEVLGLSSTGDYRLEHLFIFKARTDDQGRVIGHHQYSGKPPSFFDEIAIYGLPLPSVLAENATR
jgi:pilus assembly protein CpaF